jgi:hypothetical protein
VKKILSRCHADFVKIFTTIAVPSGFAMDYLKLKEAIKGQDIVYVNLAQEKALLRS